MEKQTYHIQQLLADELDNCKREVNGYIEEHIKKIQDVYKQEDIVMMEQEFTKGKQQMQDKEVFFYRPYKVSSHRPKSPEPTFIQDKIENLKKYIKFMQALIQTTTFNLPPYYKSLQPHGEQDEQYQKEIVIAFLKKKHNTDIIRKDFSIKMYTGGPPYEPYFIVLTLWGQVIIGPTKKLVATYMVGDLALLDYFMRT